MGFPGWEISPYIIGTIYMPSYFFMSRGIRIATRSVLAECSGRSLTLWSVTLRVPERCITDLIMNSDC
jgi:hypothetical protein